MEYKTYVANLFQSIYLRFIQSSSGYYILPSTRMCHGVITLSPKDRYNRVRNAMFISTGSSHLLSDVERLS